MSDIPYILDKIKKLNVEKAELDHKSMNISAEVSKLTSTWKEQCSHPEEYLNQINTTYEDDYGKRIENKDYQYQCVACGSIFEKNEVEGPDEIEELDEVEDD